MSNLKYRLVNNWHFARMIRLGMGLFMLVLSIQMRDWIFGLVSLAIAGMALTNTGCCAAQSCALP